MTDANQARVVKTNLPSKSSYVSGKNDESVNKGGEKTWSKDSSIPGNVLCTVESVKTKPFSVRNPFPWFSYSVSPFESFDT